MTTTVLRPTRVMLAVGAVATASLAAQSAAGQSPGLAVLRYTPSGTGTPGSLITITFDRPVAGQLERTVDPHRFVRLDPAIPGQTSWRDPITIRFVPDEPFVPGSSVMVTIDSGLVAIDGRKLATPYRFTVRFPGPTPLTESVDGASPYADRSGIGPRPTFRVLYSAPVNLDSLLVGSQLDFNAPCAVQKVALIPVRERPIVAGEGMDYTGAGGWDRDTVGDRFRRVVELVPADTLPAGCRGLWRVRSFDPATPEDHWSYNVSTAPALRITTVSPWLDNRTDEPDGLRLLFSVPVPPADVKRYVHVTPRPGPATIAWSARIGSGPGASDWSLATKLTPRATYTITVDSAIRDIFGRPLTGPRTFTVVAHDRNAGVRQQVGFATIPASVRSMKVRFVNVDTLTMLVVPIPDSLLAPLLATPVDQRADLLRKLRPAMRDTLRVDTPIRARFNSEGIASVPLPRAAGQPGAPHFFEVRFAIKARSRAPDSVTPPRPAFVHVDTVHPQVMPGVVTVGRETVLDLGLVAQVSDLAAQAKIAGDRGAVFVTHLGTGGPAAGATVTLYDANHLARARGQTDADGLAMLISIPGVAPQVIPAISRDPALGALRYLEIVRGEDRLILPITGSFSDAYSDMLAPWRLGARPAAPSLVRATLSTDRDLYRPGDMLYAKAIVRTGLLGALIIPAGDSVRLSLVGRDTLWSRTTRLSALGTVTDSVRIPFGASLGSYSARSSILLDGVWQPAGSASVRVAEYRAPEFLFSIAPDSAVRYLGDTLIATLQADYLFGAPMSGAAIHWDAYLAPAQPWELSIPGTSGYAVGQSSWWEASPRPEWAELRGTDSLDGKGNRALLVATKRGSMTQPATLTLVVQATDASNRTVSAQRISQLNAASIYIAARARLTTQYWRVGEAQTIEAFTVHPDGKRVAGVPLRITIARLRWSTDSTAGVPAGSARWVPDTVSRTSTVSRTTPVPIRFTPLLDGPYDIRIEAADDSGRPAITNLGGWVYSAAHTAMPNEDALALHLSASTKPFALGDTATVTFDSPFPLADAWITFEREGVIEQRRRSVVAGRSTIRVPITARDAPNIWVGVTLVRWSSALLAGVDSLAQFVRAGYVELMVDSTANMLRVTVESAAPWFSPGDSATIRLAVHDMSHSGNGRGTRSEVAVWAVDQGVLSLTGFKTPDILNAIYAHLGVSDQLHMSLAGLPWRIPLPVGPGLGIRTLQLGTDAIAGIKAPYATVTIEDRQMPADIATRADFRPTAFFVGSVMTGDDGSATIRAKLPDNITTFRLMAVAVAASDRYGSGEGTLLVTRDVILRPALPRFVRSGDQFTIGAAVNLRVGQSAALDVEASAIGATLSGESTRRADLTPSKGSTVRFDVSVPGFPPAAADATRFTFRATGSVTSTDGAVRPSGDAIALSLPIRPEGTPRAHTVIGVVRDSASVRLVLPGDIDPERSRMTIGLGPSPLTAMRNDYERLRAYPYYSTDMIVSSARALLAIYHTERAAGDPGARDDSAEVMSDLQRASDEIAHRQRDGGWIAYWPDDGFSLGLPVTAAAGSFLLDARRAGVQVAPSVLAGITTALTSQLRDPAWKPDTITGSPAERRQRLRAWLGERMTDVRYLRDAGTPDSLGEAQLLRWAASMAWEDRLSLASLLGERPGGMDQARALLTAAWRGVTVAGTRLDFPDSLRGIAPFPSHIRPAARLLTTTLELLPDHPLLGALAETVMQQGSAEQTWAWNTQDYASAVVSLGEFAKTQRTNLSSARRVVVRAAGGRTVLARTASLSTPDSTAPLTGLLTRTADDHTALALTVSTEGATDSSAHALPLYYSITVHEVPRTRPVTPDIAGIVVERWYERFEDGTPIVIVNEGDLVRVHLRVTVPSDRQFVAVEDLLPAGLEAVDLSLRTIRPVSPFTGGDLELDPARGRLPSSGPAWQSLLYGNWDDGWWSPWEHKEMYDDRVLYVARELWTGTYNASYVARATTPGIFVLPPAHAEEMYNAAVEGRSEGGVFTVRRVDGAR